MTRKSWRSDKPLDAFTSGYQTHRTDRRAIHEWTIARLRRFPPSQIRQWLDDGEKKASDALEAFSVMSPTTKVERAKANATAHRDWIRLVRAELEKLRPARAIATRRRRPPLRPGYLQTETKAFQPDRPRKDA
ncbi:hypothetical protein JIX59_16515 [Brevundimonas diminuta]|uniref:hypothetical protein n=1 Tax=Brevundimonas diminuta TaxID=293 RepID=UPI001906719F|nr:hypothetical protein [Brevundimonas diminuta]MBK1970946.1 hypothetical protein [Brevundimonas diminuta]